MSCVLCVLSNMASYLRVTYELLRVATSCYDIQGDFSRVASTSREFTTTYLHSYEYPRVSTESRGPWFDPHWRTVMCPWARHTTSPEYWLIPKKRWLRPHDCIFYWDVKPQYKRTKASTSKMFLWTSKHRMSWVQKIWEFLGLRIRQVASTTIMYRWTLNFELRASQVWKFPGLREWHVASDSIFKLSIFTANMIFAMSTLARIQFWAHKRKMSEYRNTNIKLKFDICLFKFCKVFLSQLCEDEHLRCEHDIRNEHDCAHWAQKSQLSDYCKTK